jgi:hypothetical protein
MHVRTTTRLVLLALGFALAAPRRAQAGDDVANKADRRVELARLDPRVRGVLTAWLATDCEAGERTHSLSRVLSEGLTLQAALHEAMTLGPPPERVDATRAAARAAYAQRQESLKREGAKLFGPEETERLLAEPVEAYEARATKTLDLGWRERATLALGQIGDARTLAELGRIAANPDDPNSEAAKRALEARKTKPAHR